MVSQLCPLQTDESERLINIQYTYIQLYVVKTKACTCIPLMLWYSWFYPHNLFHWNLSLHRPDRGVDQHLVKSCSCLPERGKARGAESQPSCFTSPSGTASQRPAGNRCHLLTTAGKSTKKWEVSRLWRTHSSNLKASTKSKAKWCSKTFTSQWTRHV